VASARDVALLNDLEVSQRVALDVTDARSIDEALASCGELDAVVNNAALQGAGVLEDYPLDHLRRIVETNTIGPLSLIQRLVPSWRERGSGVIVNVSSVQGRVSSPLEGAYAASKYALEALSESLHYELGHFGIRTVIIEPGYIAPGMKPSFTSVPNEAYSDLYEQWSGTDAKVLGGERPGPELVGRAIVRALEDPATPLRVPVGADAELILATRSSLPDREFESLMRQTLGLTW